MSTWPAHLLIEDNKQILHSLGNLNANTNWQEIWRAKGKANQIVALSTNTEPSCLDYEYMSQRCESEENS